MDHLALKVDQVHRPVLLENGGKKGKTRTGALRVAGTQADTPTFECVLLDYLGHQDLQFHSDEYGTLGGGPSFEFEDGGTSLLCWADAVHPTFSATGFSADKSRHDSEYRPRRQSDAGVRW